MNKIEFVIHLIQVYTIKGNGGVRMLKDLGKGLGAIVDTAISQTGSFVSKGVKKTGLTETAAFVEETTAMIGKASNAGLFLTGQAAQGVYQAAKGQLTQDTYERAEGVDELKDASKRVVSGLGQTLKMGATNTYETGAGLLTKDYDRAEEISTARHCCSYCCIGR